MQLEMEFLDASSCLHFLDGFLDAFGKLFFSLNPVLIQTDPVQIAEWKTDPV